MCSRLKLFGTKMRYYEEFDCGEFTSFSLHKSHITYYTPARTLSISGLKSRDGEKWSRIFHLEIHRAPSEIPANLPGQFSLSGQMFLHWAVATLNGLGEF